MEQVRWVRIRTDGASTRYEVVGIGHRRPVVRAIPVRMAAALIAAGVPVVRFPPAA